LTLATNGDFDQTMELSENLLTAAASATLGIKSEPEDLPAGLGVTGKVMPTGKLKRIWFRTRPFPWRSESGFGNLTRNTSDVITLALRVDVHIEVETARIVVNNQTKTIDTSDPIYAQFRPIDFSAFVEVEDHVEVQTLEVTMQREHDPPVDIDAEREARESAVQVPCVVIDFNTKPALFGRDWPRVDVKIRRSDVQGADAMPPKNVAVQAMMAAAVNDAQGDGAAGDAALTDLVDRLIAIITSKVTETVQSMTTWQLKAQDRGKVLLYPPPPPKSTADPPLPKGLGVKTLPESLFIGIDYLAKRGRTQNVTLSTLRGQGALLDDLGVTVSNRWFLRGIIRGMVATMFARVAPKAEVYVGPGPNPSSPPTPLTAADFVGNEFCNLKSPVTNSLDQGVTLETLFAFVNNSSELEIGLEISKKDDPLPPGVYAHANLDLRFSFSLKRGVAGASQTLELTTAFDNPTTAITGKRVDLDWWWYVLALSQLPVVTALTATPVVGGTTGLGAIPLAAGGIALFFGVLAPDKISEIVNERLKSIANLPSTSIAFPLPVTIERPGVELNDPGAPPMATPLGLAMSSVAGGHDLYVGAGFSELLPPEPTPAQLAQDPYAGALKVEFVIPDSDDPGGRLDGIGGMLTPSSEWRLPIDDAIALVDAGRLLTVEVPPAPVTEVITAVGLGGVPYLRTKSDDFGANNLGNLPTR
jgi:hypothetical protein